MWTDSLKYSSSLFLGEGFLSEEFRLILSEKLKKDLINQTRIKDIIKVSKLQFCPQEYAYISERHIQKLKMHFLIVHEVLPVWVVWETNSDIGIPVRPFHSKIDEKSVKMWFEGLPVEKILNEYYKEPPKINIENSNLNYKLKIFHFFNESMYLIVSKNEEGELVEIADLISNEINNWNIQSEKNCRKNGIIHNSRIHKKSSNRLEYYIDLGSASEAGLISILQSLNSLDYIKSVKVTSFP